MGRIKGKLLQIQRNRFLKKKIQVQDKRTDIFHCGNKGYGGFDVVDSVVRAAGHAIIYSFGIGEDLSFSESALKRWDCDVYAFDPTPRAIKYVKSHPVYKNERFHFMEFGLSDEDGEGEFHLPQNESFVSGSFVNHENVKSESIKVQMKKLDTIMKELGHEKIDVLKMDIEGTEFAVLCKYKMRDFPFVQLCVEVHDRFFENGRSLLLKLVDKLNTGGYRVVSISSNFEEYTFLKNKK